MSDADSGATPEDAFALRKATVQARAGQAVPGDDRRNGASAPRDHRKLDADVMTPHAARAAPEDGTPDQLVPHFVEAEDRQEALVDEAVEETFPASDPVSAKQIT
ncbi:MAG TPA: hypothetical protein DCG71_08490 [Brevundimonas sp.]|nr:hypothetical protein [Brevundimonas sp.]